MRRIGLKELIIGFVFIFVLGVYVVQGADSRSYPVTASYCDGSTLEVYPFSFVTRSDDSTFNCYEVLVSPIENGYRYGFEDKDDGDYNDIIVELWITGNGTSSPIVHVKYISKDASYKHWVYLVGKGRQQLIFKAEETVPGAVFNIPLPVRDCSDFEINASPSLQIIEQGGSTNYSVTINALHGFTDNVNLSVTGLPEETSGIFQTNPLPITGESKLDITSTSQVPVGSYPLTITGTAGEISHSTQVTLEVKEKPLDPDFTIEADPVKQTIYPGEFADFKIKVTAKNGFSKSVKLYVEPLPEGVTSEFQPGVIKPTKESKLTLTTSQNTPLGTYALTVSARGGGINRKVKITLTLEQQPPEPDFQIKAHPSDRILHRGESTDYTITLTALNGFSQNVFLEVTGIPFATSAVFSPENLIPTGTSQLKITSSIDTPMGDATLVITAKGNNKEHSTTVKLSVVCRDFSLKINAEPEQGAAPLSVQLDALVTNKDDFSDQDYSYLWSFGDGNTSNLQKSQHVFQAPGNYQVKLVVTDPCGNSKTAFKTINVEGFEGSVTKSFSVSEALPGDEVYFTIETRNNTRYDFTNLIIRDDLSPLLEYIGDDAPVTLRRNGQELIWQLPKLPKGETFRLQVKVKVSENATPGNINNVAHLYHDSLGPGKRFTSNTASLTINKMDVNLIKQVEQTTAKPGDTIKYTLVIKNNSNIPLTGIKLMDELSKHLEFISQTGNLTFSRQGQQLQWTGTLDAQQQGVILFKARTGHETFSNTLVQNKALLEAEELRAPIESNMVETIISSEPVSVTKVLFSKRSEVPQTEVGRIIRFNITVANKSNSSLISPVVQDYLPQGFSYVASSTLLNNQRYAEPQGKRRLLWQLPHIKPAETLVLRFQVVIGADAKRGRNINQASLRTTDNSGQEIFLEASAFINVSTIGFIFYSGVEGTVYLDRNHDDFYSRLDTPLEGIEVRLSTGEKAITNTLGHYSFEHLFPGEYAVGVNKTTLPKKYKLASPYPRVVVLADGLTDNVDFAVNFKGENPMKNSRLEGRVFFDKNQNQVFDRSDPLCRDFKVKLNDTLLTRGRDGTFVFADLEPGTHKIQIIFGTRTMTKEIILKQGKNYIDIPLIYSGIKIIIKGEEQ